MTRPTPTSGAAFWSAAGTAAVQLLTLAATLVAARCLGPSTFGTVGVALLATALASNLTDVALGPALVSRRLSDGKTIAGAHWFSMATGAATCALVVVAGPVIGRLVRDGAVGWTLLGLGPGLIFAGATLVPLSLLQRDGRFLTVALLRIGQQVLSSAGTIGLAAGGAGLWALVVPGVVASAAMAVACCVAARWWPAPALDWPRLGPFVRDGLRVTGHNLCNYVARNADNAIIGLAAGTYALGLYAFAYGLLLRPLELFSHSLTPVLLHSLGLSRCEPERTSAQVVDATAGVLRAGAPVMIGGALTCGTFVPLLFGPQWTPAVPLVRVLMITGAVQLVGPVFGAMVLARGANAFLLRWGVWTATAALAMFTVGQLAAGPLGVAWGCLLYTVGAIGAMYVIARRLFRLPLAGLGPRIVAVLRDLAVMSLAVGVTALALHRAGASSTARLAGEVGAGALAYAVAFRLLSADQAAALIGALPLPLSRGLARALRLPARSHPPSSSRASP